MNEYKKCKPKKEGSLNVKQDFISNGFIETVYMSVNISTKQKWEYLITEDRVIVERNGTFVSFSKKTFDEYFITEDGDEDGDNPEEDRA